ncbi:hypothetical protein CEXT_532561, partial [Caerostris extrusa]
ERNGGPRMCYLSLSHCSLKSVGFVPDAHFTCFSEKSARASPLSETASTAFYDKLFRWVQPSVIRKSMAEFAFP